MNGPAAGERAAGPEAEQTAKHGYAQHQKTVNHQRISAGPSAEPPYR